MNGEKRRIQQFSISELEKRRPLDPERANLLAVTDLRTGLRNANWLEQYGNTMFREIVVEGQGLMCAVMIDVDHFKYVNDLGGHTMGNEVLKMIAELLLDQKNGFRKDIDAVVRYGGDENLVLVPGVELWQAMKVAERVVNNMKTLERGNLLIPTLSIGVACSNQNLRSLDALIEGADGAAYLAKINRNMIVAYSPNIPDLLH